MAEGSDEMLDEALTDAPLAPDPLAPELLRRVRPPAAADDVISHFIETRPYTTAVMALALGWLFGRVHRPF
jgi:hypothetical protein